MTPELEARLAQEAAENCYSGQHLHALRRGAELALEWLPIDSAPTNQHVLLCYLNACGKHRTIIAVNANQFTLEASEEYFDGEYCEEKYGYFLPAGWYEYSDNMEDYSYANVDERAVLAGWMPLPQPPQVKP